MKRGLWKKMAALSLAAVLSLGLVACNGGGSGDDHGGQSGNREDIGGGSGGNASQAGKENVYSCQELDLLGSNDNVVDMRYRDGKLYLFTDRYGGSGEDFVEENARGIYRANIDGSDSGFVQLASPEREETGSWLVSGMITDGGYIYAVVNSSYENTSDPDNLIYEDRTFLDCWDMEGKLQWSKRLDSGNTEEWTYCNKLLDGGEGRALTIMGGVKNEAVLYSPQGEEVSRKELDGGIFGRLSGMYTGEDGQLTALYYDEEYEKQFMAAYDIETGQLGESSELTFGNSYSIRNVQGQELLLTDGMGVYTWSVGDAEPKMLMNIVNSELAANELSHVQIVDDQHFVAIYNDLANWAQKCAYFTYVDPASIQDRAELALGGLYIGTDVKAKVIQFNKTSEQYRITLKDYNVYNTSEDWTAGQTRLNADIINGQMPDIMVIDNMSNYSNYVSKGLLADVGQLLEADPETSQLEYLQNVWDAFRVNGTLYAVVPSFSVRTMIAKKSLVGEPSSWTMADMEAVLATMPEGATAFGSMIRDGFIYQMISYAGQDFVDMETGKCSFNSQSFIEMLEYARTLPAEDPQNYEEDYDWAYYENQYRENRSLLYDLYIGNIKDCKYQIRGNIGEAVSFVGFPTANSNGSTLSPGNYAFMISARSDQLDGAWQFVRQFLLPEYQTGSELYDMPVLKSAFLDKAQEATERPYWTDENGNREYYDDTWNINGEEVILEPFTQEEVDAMCEFIYSVNRTSYYNEYISNIITEEAAAFFEGQKSAQEVADIIQSRAQVYVDENR